MAAKTVTPACVTFTAMAQTERQEAISRVQRDLAGATGSGDVPQGSTVPEGGVKEDEVVRALIHRGLKVELILKWPTPLSELLEFSRAGDMNVRGCTSQRVALQSVPMCVVTLCPALSVTCVCVLSPEGRC